MTTKEIVRLRGPKRLNNQLHELMKIWEKEHKSKRRR